MKNKFLSHQYKFRLDPLANAKEELAVLILKPGFTNYQKTQVHKFVSTNHFKLLHQANFQFDHNSTLAIYNDIFKFSDNDILFGYNWKGRKLAYMVSAPSYIFVIKGQNVQALSEAFKYKIRDEYGKLSIPDKKLNIKDFDELAIKNVIHVVDGNDTEIALWLLTN